MYCFDGRGKTAQSALSQCFENDNGQCGALSSQCRSLLTIILAHNEGATSSHFHVAQGEAARGATAKAAPDGRLRAGCGQSQAASALCHWQSRSRSVHDAEDPLAGFGSASYQASCSTRMVINLEKLLQKGRTRHLLTGSYCCRGFRQTEAVPFEPAALTNSRWCESLRSPERRPATAARRTSTAKAAPVGPSSAEVGRGREAGKDRRAVSPFGRVRCDPERAVPFLTKLECPDDGLVEPEVRL